MQNIFDSLLLVAFLLFLHNKVCSITSFNKKGKIYPFECRIAKNSKERLRKPSSVISAKKQRKTTEWERLEISSGKSGIKGTNHAKTGTIKDKNGTDLKEADDIKNRWQEYTEVLYKKDLHDQDNHYGVITQQEPDILDCEIKRPLESITMNKASGGDGIPVELSQILKDGAVKVPHSICQRIRKTQQWPQDWKRSVFSSIPKKGNAKECSNYGTIALLSHASKVMLKFSKPGFSNT